MTRNIGIEEAHGEYLFFLDYDDTLNHINDLQYYYEEAVKNNYPDIIASSGIIDSHFNNNYREGIRPILIKNSYLKSKNIRYNDLYFNEDALFFSKILLNTNKILILDRIIYNYNRDNIYNTAKKLGIGMIQNEVELGIAICGTGIGMSIAANKVKGIRCAHVTNKDEARFHKMF